MTWVEWVTVACLAFAVLLSIGEWRSRRYLQRLQAQLDCLESDTKLGQAISDAEAVLDDPPPAEPDMVQRDAGSLFSRYARHFPTARAFAEAVKAANRVRRNPYDLSCPTLHAESDVVIDGKTEIPEGISVYRSGDGEPVVPICDVWVRLSDCQLVGTLEGREFRESHSERDGFLGGVPVPEGTRIYMTSEGNPMVWISNGWWLLSFCTVVESSAGREARHDIVRARCPHAENVLGHCGNCMERMK